VAAAKQTRLGEIEAPACRARRAAFAAFNRAPTGRYAASRLEHTSLTRRNVGGSPTPGTHDVETALVGWGAWIRTWEWRNQNPF
jgi:hypothetical protein